MNSDLQSKIDSIKVMNLDTEIKNQMLEKFLKDHGYDDDAVRNIISQANF